MKYLKPLFFFLFIIQLQAQEFSISGTVADENNIAIPYVNIIAVNTLDDTDIKGVSTDENGGFEISGLKENTYQLKASFLGYETFIKTIILKVSILERIVLKESSENLDEVTIVANKPTLKKEVDRLVFNIANTSLSQGTILEALRSTPSVLILGDNITIKNSNPTVFINDRKVHLSASELTQLLESSPANSIKKIEVITNPPAKYDAESGVVLNIVMSKNLVTGYRGNVFTNYWQGVFARYNGGINQFYKTKKINLNLNYSYKHAKINRENEEEINYPDQIWNTDLNRNTTSKTHNANLNFDYYIDENSTLSLSSNVLYLPFFEYLTRGKTAINAVLDTDDFSFNSNNFSQDDKYNLGVDLDYKITFKNGARLLINTHITRYDYNRNQNVNSDYFDNNNGFDFATAFNTKNNQETEILTSQLDYELPLSESSNFSAGIKSSNVETESDITQLDINTTTGNQTLNIANTNTFIYDESVYAGYISYNKDWEKWSFSGGLRAEQTDIEGISPTTNTTNTQNYLDWFPTVNLSLQAFEKANVYTNYKRSISRPDFQDLNPFNFFLNDNTIVRGNPNLQPSFTNHFVVGTSLSERYTIEAYYKDTEGDIYELPLQDNLSNILVYSPTNINNTREFGFDFITYFDMTDTWSVYFVTSLYNIQDQTNFNSSSLKMDQWSNYSVLSNDFSLLKDKSLSANFTLTYASKNQQGFQIVDSRFISDLSFSKKVFKDKGTLSLAFADLFNQQDFEVRSKYENQDNRNFTNIDNRYVKLGFSYKFGNTTLQTNERIKELNERERLED